MDRFEERAVAPARRAVARPRWVALVLAVAFSAAGWTESAEELAAATFDDGTIGAFAVVPAGTVRVVDDPLRSGRGNVAELTYRAGGGARPARAALALTPPAGRFGLGSTITISGDLLIPAATFNLRNPSIRRTLVSLRAPLSVNPADSTDAFVLLEFTGGCELRVEWSHEGYWRGSDCRLAPLDAGRWHRIVLAVTMNSAPDRHDGVLELSVNDSTVLRDSTVRFTNPMRPGAPSWQELLVGATRFRPEVRGGFDLSDGDTIDERRYWDNLVVRATRRD
jgi:hypothetical protein